MQSLLAFIWHCHCAPVTAWTNPPRSKWWQWGKDLWWWWAGDKEPHKSAGVTHWIATQIILLLLLLMFHGAIYYCRVFSATQTISLADCLYQVLKSVLHQSGTLWFQTSLITGCHLGTSITGIMRRNQTNSPSLSLTVIQWCRRKCTKLQTFLCLLKNNFYSLGSKAAGKGLQFLSI